ncbi:MAG: sigma-70 family RNA polymerase sigma factor [Ilumatobacter sp.]|uniref:RNA polymerase sigma factor n=1 Tax=Ilumatobacter sp. TaxID=1967498 RepID=UPI003C765036
MDQPHSAFDELYASEFATTVRLARFLSGDSGAAEDLAQDAFIRVYRYLDEPVRPVEDLVALLRTTTMNVCRSWHRSRRRRDLRMAHHGVGEQSLSEWERELDASMRRLPYDQRAVVVLRHWLGWSEAEIATALQCRPGTVKSRHARAIESLRKELS